MRPSYRHRDHWAPMATSMAAITTLTLLSIASEWMTSLDWMLLARVGLLMVIRVGRDSSTVGSDYPTLAVAQSHCHSSLCEICGEVFIVCMKNWVKASESIARVEAIEIEERNQLRSYSPFPASAAIAGLCQHSLAIQIRQSVTHRMSTSRPKAAALAMQPTVLWKCSGSGPALLCAWASII